MKLFILAFTIVIPLKSLAQDHGFIKFNRDKELRFNNNIETFSRELSGKMIVFLGDIIHGEANIDSLRAVVIDYLIREHDFNTLAFESGIYDLHIADKEINKGQNVNSVLSESIYSVWSGPSLQPLIDIIDKNKQQIKLIGFDPKLSGIHYADIDLELYELLKGTGITPDSSVITAFADICEALTLWEVSNLEPDHFNTIFEEVKGLLDQAAEGAGKTDELRIWLQVLRNIKGLYHYLKIEGIADQSENSWKPEMANTRDSLMATNLKFYMQLFPQSKIICWGASGHFARSLDHLKAPDIQKFRPMGSYFGNEALSIGAMGYSGEYGWTGNLYPMPDLPENSVEFKLSQIIDNAALVSLDGFKNEGPLFSSVFVEADPIAGDWSTVFDWVIFSKEISPKTGVAIINDKSHEAGDTRTDEKPDIALPLLREKQVLVLRGKGVMVEGQVLNASGEPVPFSSLFLKGLPYGTVCNEKGQFFIRIPNSGSDTLTVSNVAYKIKELPLQNIDANNFLTIILDEKTVTLPEIIISDKKSTALGILNESIERIGENFYQGPFSNLVLQKSILLDSVNKTPASIQWLAKIYVPNGYSSNRYEPNWKLIQARKGTYRDLGQRFIYKPYKPTIYDFIGISLADRILYHDNSFLDIRRHKHFSFHLEDIVTISNKQLYKISFICNRIGPKTSVYHARDAKIFRGNIFINTEDFAILKIESEIVWDIDDLPLKKHNEPDPQQQTLIFRTTVEYEKINGYYFQTYASRFENYVEFGFREYFHTAHVLGEINDFQGSIEVENSNTPADWAEIIKIMESN